MFFDLDVLRNYAFLSRFAIVRIQYRAVDRFYEMVLLSCHVHAWFEFCDIFTGNSCPRPFHSNTVLFAVLFKASLLHSSVLSVV